MTIVPFIVPKTALLSSELTQIQHNEREAPLNFSSKSFFQ